jgi:hypothetical protein
MFSPKAHCNFFLVFCVGHAYTHMFKPVSRAGHYCTGTGTGRAKAYGLLSLAIPSGQSFNVIQMLVQQNYTLKCKKIREISKKSRNYFAKQIYKCFLMLTECFIPEKGTFRRDGD